MHALPVERHFMDSCGGSDAISQAGDRGGTLTHGGRPTMPSLPLVRPVHNMGFLSNAARTTFHRIPLHLCKGLSWEVTMEPKNHTKWDSSGCVCLWLFARMYVCMCLFVWLHNCIGEFGEVRPAWGQTSLTRSDPPPNISPPTPHPPPSIPCRRTCLDGRWCTIGRPLRLQCTIPNMEFFEQYESWWLRNAA